jgi:hypothetical protein
VLLKHLEVVLKQSIAVLVVKVGIVLATVYRINDPLGFVHILRISELLVDSEVPLEQLDFLNHFDIVAVVDVFHLLQMLFGDFLGQDLLRILFCFLLEIVAIVQVGSARVQIDVRVLVQLLL